MRSRWIASSRTARSACSTAPGRMWFFNSAGLERYSLIAHAPPGLEREGDRYTGRLFDEDLWLQQALGSEPPSFAQVGRMLAQMGVTGLTEMSPGNDALIGAHFIKETSSQALPQRVLLAGQPRTLEVRHDRSRAVRPCQAASS